MARAAGAPIHICHVSAARTTELIADAKSSDVDVTAEAPAHYLLLDESAFITFGARVKTTPPLRSPADNDLLWQALAEGVLDTIASDHYTENLEPYPPEAVLIEKAAAGIAGLELSLPLLFHAGVKGGRISLRRFVEATAARPAQIGGIASRKGRIAIGLDADFVLINPSESWTVTPRGDFSRIAGSPFLGQTLQGRICQTWVRGRPVWDGQDILVQPGWGRWIPSRSSVND
jgi:allantoinase